MRSTVGLRRVDMSLADKVWQINWPLVILVCLIATIGFAVLYSAAGGSYEPWAIRQAVRFAVGLGVMLTIALIDTRLWLKLSYLIYLGALALLLAVEVMGTIGMGAQRWMDLGMFQIQPSEIMKIALILALARYFHGLTVEEVGRPLWLIAPAAMVLVPTLLILRQPDLGTAALILFASAVIFFLAGVRTWKFGVILAIGAAAMPFAWNLMHGYQQERILTFLNPERDPLGAGYHILQSKIALGSGGIFGKGFLLGTQSHLSFLPEKQTDFIFTMLAEEFGLAGGVFLILLYVTVLAYGYAISLRARSQFGRLLGLGVTTIFFLYVFINVAMVIGLIPVVGVPLPLVSYGGTSLMTLMVGLGLLLGVWIHRDIPIGRRANEDD